MEKLIEDSIVKLHLANPELFEFSTSQLYDVICEYRTYRVNSHKQKTVELKWYPVSIEDIKNEPTRYFRIPFSWYELWTPERHLQNWSL